MEKHLGPYETWGTTSALYADGSATGRHVPGFAIEVQYACGDGFVLITSYDCPFEEAQNFLLLDRAFRVTGREFLGVMYGSYMLMKSYVVDDSRIALEFAGDDRPWILDVRPDRWRRSRRLRLVRSSATT
ncbi:MAG TPA: hypothetical protein VGI81_03730 [Tepidisphaeraceae bacterium]